MTNEPYQTDASASALALPAKVAVERLAVRSGERVAVVHNGPQAEIAAAIAAAAESHGAEVRLVEFVAPARHGMEPSAEIAELLLWSNAGFGVTSASLSHTQARLNACKAGARFASMPLLTADIFARTLPVDYDWMSSAGAAIAELMSSADSARVTSPEGTDVTLSLAGREGRNDDGNYSTPGAFGNLPAGEGYIAPVENAGEGTIVFDGSLTGYGVLDEPIAVHIKDGAVIGAEGAAADYLLATLEAAGPTGKTVAEFAIGTNPAAKIVGIVLEDEKVLGTAHIAFGTSAGIGGTNQSTIHIDGIMQHPTVDIGGTRVLENEQLLVVEARA